MPFAEIRTAIKTIVSAVSKAGNVHEYDRQTSDPQKFLDLFRWSDPDTPDVHQVRGWTITREGTTEERLSEGGTSGDNLVTHHLVLKAYLSLDDDGASEMVCHDLVDRVCEQLRKDPKILTAYGVSVYGQDEYGEQVFRGFLHELIVEWGPPQVRREAYWVLGDVLCHYAEIAYAVVEIVRR